MAGPHSSARLQSMRIAFCSMLVALSVVLMLSGSLVPVMTYVSPLAAAILLLPIRLEFGRRYAWTAWLATALIVLLLGVDKEAAFFYTFLGYYPIIKWDIDLRIRHAALRLFVKILLFATASVGMYGVMALLFGAAVVFADFAEMGMLMSVVFFLLLVVCMLMYDRLLVSLLLRYEKKLRGRLPFFHR